MSNRQKFLRQAEWPLFRWRTGACRAVALGFVGAPLAPGLRRCDSIAAAATTLAEFLTKAVWHVALIAPGCGAVGAVAGLAVLSPEAQSHTLATSTAGRLSRK